MAEPRKIFISYAREDEAFCLQLATMLEGSGYSVWIDRHIPTGQSWAASITEAIQNTDDIIAVMSKASLGRSYQAKGEWLHAYDLGARVLPVLLDSVRVHPVFAHIQAIDFAKPGTMQEHFQELISAIQQAAPNLGGDGYKVSLGGDIAEYPNWFHERAVTYSSLLNRSRDIRCLTSTGYRFLSRHDGTLIARLEAGARLRMVIGKPTLHNLTTLASWSIHSMAELDDFVHKRLIPEVKEGARRLENVINADIPRDAVEIRLMEYLPPFTLIQVDVEEPMGLVVLSLYRMGYTLTNQRRFRPATLISRPKFMDFYDHLKLSFENAWDKASPIDTLDYIERVITAVPW